MSYVNGHTHVDMSEKTPVAGRVCVGVGVIERIRTNRKKDVFGKENNSVFAHGYVAFLHAHVSWPFHLSYFRFHIKYKKTKNRILVRVNIRSHCTCVPQLREGISVVSSSRLMLREHFPLFVRRHFKHEFIEPCFFFSYTSLLNQSLQYV